MLDDVVGGADVDGGDAGGVDADAAELAVHRDEVGHDRVLTGSGEDITQFAGGHRALHRAGVAGVPPGAFADLVLDTARATGEALALPGVAGPELTRPHEQAARLGQEGRRLRVVGRGDTTSTRERGAATFQGIEQGGRPARADRCLDVDTGQVDAVRRGGRDGLDGAEPAAVVDQEAEPRANRTQPVRPVARRECQLGPSGVVLDPHGQRSVDQASRQLVERRARSGQVAGKKQPLCPDQPRRMAGMLAEHRARRITLDGHGERLRRPPAGNGLGQRLGAAADRREGRLELEDTSERRPLLVTDGQEVLPGSHRERGCLLEAPEREQAPGAKVLGDGAVGAEACLEQLRYRLAQEGFRLLEQTDPVQNLGAPLQRNAVVLVRREFPRGRHLGERRRSVAEHAQVVARVVPGEGHDHRCLGGLRVPHGRKVVGHGGFDVTEV